MDDDILKANLGQHIPSALRETVEGPHIHAAPGLPTHAELIQALHAKRATLPVDHINHREFVMDGIRYFCGYDSNCRAGTGRVTPGWFTYKSEEETPT